MPSNFLHSILSGTERTARCGGFRSVGVLNLRIANEFPSAEPGQTIRLRIERVIASRTNRFRQDLAYRWRQYETVTAKAYGKKESRMLGMVPQNRIFVWRDVIVPGPSPLPIGW